MAHFHNYEVRDWVLLQYHNVIVFILDDSEDNKISDLQRKVYKEYETEFKRANVGLSDLEFFALVRPICIESYCWKRLLLVQPSIQETS